MPGKTELENKHLNAWMLLHQAHKLVARSEDIVFAKIGITTQQHAVLAAIKSIVGPVTPSEVAHWLYQNPNGVSMLLNRMEGDGLVRRLRKSRDRRAVQLVLTKKGKGILEQSNLAGWQLINQIMGELPKAELGAFIQMLERLREVAFDFVNPGGTGKDLKARQEANVEKILAGQVEPKKSRKSR